MNALDPSSDDDGTVFRDVIMLALLGFMTIVILLLPHLNPPTNAAAAPPPGNVVVEIRWPDDLDADVDLWVEAPGDRPVGYSNREGRVFNLLRDDRGHADDLAKLNYEVAYSRGAPAGEYTVNLHFYRDGSGRLPLQVIVVVRVQTEAGAPADLIGRVEIALAQVGEEVTALRFSLDGSGKLVAGSAHQLPRPLRAADN